MQDIDFGKIKFSKKSNIKQDILRYRQKNILMQNLRKLSFAIFSFLFVFTVGLLSGIYLNTKKSESRENLEQEPITNYLGEGLKLQKETKNRKDKNTQAGKEKIISRNIGSKVENRLYNEIESAGQISSEKEKSTFLIWVKTYQDRSKAYQHGYFLKREKLPAFLARSGNKMKLYVGPINGKNEAFKILARVKGWRPFKGAILHRKK